MPRLLGFVSMVGLAVLLIGCGGTAPAAESSDHASQSEGIVVHGDWRVAIHNEDGSLDREYVFANALRDGAGDLLGQLLTVNWDDPFDGYPTPLGWTMTMGDTVSGVGPCGTSINAVAGSNPLLTTGCSLNPTAAALPGGVLDGTLVVSPIAGGIRLAASVLATQLGNIDYVETQLLVATEEGSTFPVTAGNAFTGTAVGPFEGILPGQTIQVQVDITFASPAQ